MINRILTTEEVERVEAHYDEGVIALKHSHEALRCLCVRWKKAIEGLTPSGSEFVDDPEYCAAYIRKRCDYPKMIIDLRAERDRLLAVVEAVKRVRQSYKGDGDGEPPYFGRPTIKNAWQALDTAIADAQQERTL